jgi:hypothetical protein
MKSPEFPGNIGRSMSPSPAISALPDDPEQGAVAMLLHQQADRQSHCSESISLAVSP